MAVLVYPLTKRTHNFMFSFFARWQHRSTYFVNITTICLKFNLNIFIEIEFYVLVDFVVVDRAEFKVIFLLVSLHYALDVMVIR